MRLEVARRTNNVIEIGEVYRFLATTFETTNEADTTFAMGTYFRVVYFGSSIPVHLRFIVFRFRW